MHCIENEHFLRPYSTKARLDVKNLLSFGALNFEVAIKLIITPFFVYKRSFGYLFNSYSARSGLQIAHFLHYNNY